MNTYRLTVLAALALASTQAQSGAALNNLKWDGFLNARGAVSDSSESYLGDIDDNGSFQETDYGLSASAQLSQRLRIAAQLHLSSVVTFDWGFASYAYNPNITGRVGKIKYPGTIISEYVDVGLTYPWVRPPESIYSETAELSFESYTGVSGLYEAGDDTSYNLNLYGGQISEDGEQHDKLLGAVFTLSNDYGEIKLNTNQSTVEAEGEEIDGENRAILSVGIRGEWNSVVLYSEFAHSEIDNFSESDTDAWYTTVGYRFGNTMPHMTYQDYKVDDGTEQSSWMLGVKQQLSQYSALKLEVQRISDIKNGGLFAQQPDDSDVYLFNAAMNFVF